MDGSAGEFPVGRAADMSIKGALAMVGGGGGRSAQPSPCYSWPATSLDNIIFCPATDRLQLLVMSVMPLQLPVPRLGELQ